MDGFEYFRNMAYDAAWEHTEAATAEQNAAHKLPPVGDRAAWRAIMISGRDDRDNIGPEPEPVESPGGRSLRVRLLPTLEEARAACGWLRLTWHARRSASHGASGHRTRTRA